MKGRQMLHNDEVYPEDVQGDQHMPWLLAGIDVRQEPVLYR